MKQTFTALLLMCASFSFAQTDSTEVQLIKLKRWHESGLISSDEYAKLKSEALAPRAQTETAASPAPNTKTTSPADQTFAERNNFTFRGLFGPPPFIDSLDADMARAGEKRKSKRKAAK